MSGIQSHYEVNISKEGHLFATDERSAITRHQLDRILPLLMQKFPASEGYKVSVTYWKCESTSIELPKPKPARVNDWAHSLAMATEDAYMFDAYGLEEWTRVINYLSKLCYNRKEIEAVLRSKWMRWASDLSNGKCTLAGFKKYLKTLKNVELQVVQLTQETFPNG